MILYDKDLVPEILIQNLVLFCKKAEFSKKHACNGSTAENGKLK